MREPDAVAVTSSSFRLKSLSAFLSVLSVILSVFILSLYFKCYKGYKTTSSLSPFFQERYYSLTKMEDELFSLEKLWIRLVSTNG